MVVRYIGAYVCPVFPLIQSFIVLKLIQENILNMCIHNKGQLYWRVVSKNKEMNLSTTLKGNMPESFAPPHHLYKKQKTKKKKKMNDSS